MHAATFTFQEELHMVSVDEVDGMKIYRSNQSADWPRIPTPSPELLEAARAALMRLL